MEKTNAKWFPGRRVTADAKIRLFCLPYAGGGFTTYSAWQAGLGLDIEVRPVELPGRISRFREAPFREMTALIDALYDAIEPELDRPYALFGYSMGALVAFELTRRLTREGRPPPAHVFVAARTAAHLASGPTRLSVLPDDEFLHEIQRRYRPIPAIMLEDAAMREAILTMLRGDLELLERYRYEPGPGLPCPLTAIGGTADPLVSYRELAAWSELTQARFDVATFEGGHFFLDSQRDGLLRLVRRTLCLCSPDDGANEEAQSERAPTAGGTCDGP